MMLRCTTSQILLLATVVAVHAADWPQWRGPLFNGSSPETNLPVRWSKTEGVEWVTALPGRSGATPVVHGKRAFVASPDEDKNLRLLCVDTKTGAILWQKVIGSGDRTMGKNNMASCSPVTDGRRVYALFGTSDLAAFDFDGNPVWQRRLGDEFGAFSILFLYGASPLLFQGKLYVPLIQSDPPTYAHAKDDKPRRKSGLICLDPNTGRTLWFAERKTDAHDEAMEAYTTPVPCYTSNESTPLLVLAGADAVTAHRPADGTEVWRFPRLNLRKNPGGRIVPSPVIGEGHIFVCGPKREMIVALRSQLNGIVGDEQVAWRDTTFVPDVCTPLFYEHKLFVLDGDRQTLTCYKPATGEKHWRGKLGVREIFYASPTGADGKVYCLSEEGTAVVVSAGEKFEVLATIPMGEGPCSSSIVAVDGRLFIRTAKNLYCIKGSSK